MEDSQQEEKEERLPEEMIDETERYMELLENEVWDEAIRSYNDVLFALIRYS